MGYHPRIECKQVGTFQTTRTQGSRLWFINNHKLEEAILGAAAKYSNRYQVKLYALAIEGNHVHMPAMFPQGNRAHFMRDLNASIARSVARYQPNYPGGKLWARRYSAEYLPGMEDIEEKFFYTVLQPVQDGLVDDISEYTEYNCFEDAISETRRAFKVIRWKEYNDAKRWNKNVSIEDFTEIHELCYARVPGYEHLSKEEYMRMMREKLRERTKLLLAMRGGTQALGRAALLRRKPGSFPKHTKTSTIRDHRPRVISIDNQRRANGRAWYFDIYYRFIAASKEYRSGNLTVAFPEGTYRPPTFTIAYPHAIDC